jgi:hypothetical protein
VNEDTTQVGTVRVINYAPDCDAINAIIKGGISLTESRQEDGSVEVHVQDDHVSKARTFTLGKEGSYDPHTKLWIQPWCKHDPDWDKAKPVANEPGVFDVPCKLCSEVAPVVVTKDDLCWEPRALSPPELNKTGCNHAPNWATIQTADGTSDIIDVWCESCGVSGSFRADKEDIQWE